MRFLVRVCSTKPCLVVRLTCRYYIFTTVLSYRHFGVGYRCCFELRRGGNLKKLSVTLTTNRVRGRGRLLPCAVEPAVCQKFGGCAPLLYPRRGKAVCRFRHWRVPGQ